MTETELIEHAKAYMMLSFEDEVRPFAFADTPAGLLIVAMPDSDVQTQRMILKGKLHQEKATLVVVCNESWATSASTPEEVDLCMHLTAIGRLQDAPAHLLREEMQLYAEGPQRPVTCLVSVITKIDGKRTLGEWVDRPLVLPRPTFRRYFPEIGRYDA